MRPMRPLMVFGIILTLIGVLALAYQGIAFGTGTATPIQPEPWGWVASAVAFVVGLLCMMIGGWRRTSVR